VPDKVTVYVPAIYGLVHYIVLVVSANVINYVFWPISPTADIEYLISDKLHRLDPETKNDVNVAKLELLN
jgi:hypothetical protein